MIPPPDFDDYALRCLQHVADYFKVPRLSILGRIKEAEVVRARRIMIQLMTPLSSHNLLAALLGMTNSAVCILNQRRDGEKEICEHLQRWVLPLPKPWRAPASCCETLACQRCNTPRTGMLSPHYPTAVYVCHMCGHSWRYKRVTRADVKKMKGSI